MLGPPAIICGWIFLYCKRYNALFFTAIAKFPILDFPKLIMYKPGTHIIATLSSEQAGLLTNFSAFKNHTDVLIQEHGLNKLGEVYHDFAPAGYTGVVCLSESHISIHTWPEYNKLNMDIYLSNHERSNDATVQKIYEAYVNFFKAGIVHFQTIIR